MLRLFSIFNYFYVYSCEGRTGIGVRPVLTAGMQGAVDEGPKTPGHKVQGRLWLPWAGGAGVPGQDC